jgi:uncharacterized phage protein (TIGR02218 family)
MPSSLITFLQNNPNCIKADLFSIVLPTGTTMYMTEGEFDIVVPTGTAGWSGPTTIFYATQYGRWSRGQIESSASFSFEAGTMDLTCIAQQTNLYPGTSVGILSAALNGLLDAATINVYTAYMPLNHYGNVSNGIETKFAGQLTNIEEINRNQAKFNCADYLYLLNVKVPSRIIQSNCPWSFADSNCNANAAAYTTTFTAKTGSTNWTLVPTTAFTQAAGYFNQGVVKCTGGNNSGLSASVKSHASGNLTVMLPWIMPIAAGDTFSVIAGCDKSATTCTQKFNNLIHFGGMPLVPVSTSSI